MTALRPFCMRGEMGGSVCGGGGVKGRCIHAREWPVSRRAAAASRLLLALAVGTRCHRSYNTCTCCIMPHLCPHSPTRMAAYHALSAMANPNSSSSLSIRGAASAPSRVVASALRGAGISARSHGMDVDVDGDRGVVRRGAPPRRARPSGPLDQVGVCAKIRESPALTTCMIISDWPASSTTGHAAGR